MPGANATRVLPSGPVLPVDAPQLNITVASAGPTATRATANGTITASTIRRVALISRATSPSRPSAAIADTIGIAAVASDTVTIECGTWVNRKALAYTV